MGNWHKDKAGNLRRQLKEEIRKCNKETNSDGSQGLKSIAKAISGSQGKPLMSIERDKDTKDGGKAGEITANPQEVDNVIRRAWTKIHDGMQGSIEEAVDRFLDTYHRYIFKGIQHEVQNITAQRVQESFQRTADSAGAMEGWQPKEMSLLSLKVYQQIAILLSQIENGAPWPDSTTHARVIFLEKDGAPVGKVMSYRPLTITSPLYRCWGTMRLEDLQPWIATWALEEMHAGVPGLGATDAWHDALTNLEELKIEREDFSGAVADIAKFFDQIRRRLVYYLAGAAGMPRPVLHAYRAYIEQLRMYNCVAGGIGAPYRRRCGIPQGCPFSMMMVALIMRPWIALMRALGKAVMCYILADDVLILTKGEQMVPKLAEAINTTHLYLQRMGAKVAPDKSFNFSTNAAAGATRI